MNTHTTNENRRILVIDDNRAIHQDFRKILVESATVAQLEEAEAALFGKPTGTKNEPDFEIDSAFQGQEGVAMVEHARQGGRPYALAFVDVRMPPGMDGVETVEKLWSIDPDLQVVMCTAYSDYSWDKMIEKLGTTDRLVILKKPFDAIEVLQLAYALVEKWRLCQATRANITGLEERVRERTRDLEAANEKLRAEMAERKAIEEQLLHSQKMEAIGRLAGGVAHDFNNILTAISGFTELTLMRLTPTDPSWRNLDQIKRAAHRAAALTQQLLAFSRKQMLQPRVIDLNQILADTGKLIGRLIGEDINLVMLPGSELGHVKADPGQIQQVLMNMAINARDAMPHCGTLTLRTANFTADEEFASQHSDIKPGDYVMFAVSDAGTGLTEEVRAHVFEPFFTTKEQGKGTGLGLATCFGIAKQSNGHITVDSELGRGTTFKVYLPRIEEATNHETLPAEPHSIPQGAATILLVEDSPAVRMFAQFALQQQGYTVLTASDGEEGLCIVERRNGEGLDLIVTDVVMPKMGGKTMADRIHLRHPETKVLFTSGYTDDEIVDHGVLDPGIAFLAKPYTPSALARKVREVLGDHSQACCPSTIPAGLVAGRIS